MTLNCYKVKFSRNSALVRIFGTKRMKIDPYYQRQKCRPTSLVSGSIRIVRIFAGVPLGGGVKWPWGCRRRQFLAIWVATSSERLEIRPAILHGGKLPVVILLLIAKWMTLSAIAYFMSKSVFDVQFCRALTLAIARLSCIKSPECLKSVS